MSAPEQEVEDYVDRFVDLVDLERRDGRERHERGIRSFSGRERERRGRAILELRGRDEGEALEGHRVKFMRRPGEELPETGISTGDLVALSKNDPLRDHNSTGTVVEKTGCSVTVAFEGRPPGFLTGDGLRMDLDVNDVPYRRMEDALRSLPKASDRLARLREVLVGRAAPVAAREAEVKRWQNGRLDDSQRRAVGRRALGAEAFFLFHGPPGTGKTTTVVEIARQHVERGRSVLATADSNVAVDNLVEMLAERGAEVVRMGHPARVAPTLRELGWDDLRVDRDLRSILLPEDPVVFVDTSKREGGERQRAGSTSRENPAEAALVGRLAENCRRAGVAAREIGVISPHADHTDLIRRELEDPEELEVGTVDGFQGREKALVIVSLVRSNPEGEVGFLRDRRRFNAAATRARRKLVVGGDASTIAGEEVYGAFVACAEELGTRVPR